MYGLGLLRSISRQLGKKLRRGAGPTMIANFAVTYRCTSRCRTCNIWAIGEPVREELTLDEIRGFFEANSGFLGNVSSIQITGGEPFLREDLPELVSAIREHLPRCSFWIPTNGLDPPWIEEATATMLRELDGWGLGVSVSIDGFEETHDELRGVEGGFWKAVETLKRLSALRRLHPQLGLTVGMTATPGNLGEVEGVYELASEHGAEFSVRPVSFSDVYYRNAGGEALSEESAAHLVPVFRRIARDSFERKGLWKTVPTIRYLQGALDHILDPRGRTLPCSAASDSFFIDPYGDVYPCIFMNTVLGNIRETTMEEIYLSPGASEARRTIDAHGCPSCWVECEAFRDINRDTMGSVSAALRALLDASTLGIG
jgi:MoaA/NifB/PqqE/SkfB family radical SAM enzyme